MIYKLTRIEDCGYDEFDAKIVRTSSEESAREIANGETGDEGQIWGDRVRVRCEEVDPNGPDGEILGSFNAG